MSWPFIDPSGKPPGHQRWKLPELYFDVSLDPTDGQIGVRAFLPGTRYTRLLNEEEKNLPASTHCKVTKMIIYAKDMEKWPVVAERAEGLRCIDVFEAIYKTYSVPLTEEEKNAYTPEFLRSCMPLFEQRCKEGPGLTAFNIARGLCRVDTLQMDRVFKGLSRGERAQAWTLTLGSRPH